MRLALERRCVNCQGIKPQDLATCLPCILVCQLGCGDRFPAPAREFRFHPKRRWRFDIAFVDARVGIEVDGAIYAHGRHTRGSGYQGDLDKMNAGTALGWRILRFSRADVESGKAQKVASELLEHLRIDRLSLS